MTGILQTIRNNIRGSRGNYNATALSDAMLGMGGFRNNTPIGPTRPTPNQTVGTVTPRNPASPTVRAAQTNTQVTPRTLTTPTNTSPTLAPMPAMNTTFTGQAVPVPQMYNDPSGAYASEDRYNRNNLDRFISGSQDEWNRYLTDAGIQFADDRYKLDEYAAGSGNLFGGARVKRRNKLQDSYNRDIAGKRAKLVRAIEDNLSNYEYQYGSDNTPSVSLANGNANALNPNPEITRSSSRVYRPRNGYYGTLNTARDVNEFIRNLTGQNYVRNSTRLPGYYTPNGGY